MGVPRIRMATERDAAEIAAIYAPFCESSVVSFEETAPPPEEISRRIHAITAFLPWLVLDADGRVDGFAYASRHRERASYRWAVDVTVYVADDWRRRGVGRALYVSLLELLRLQGYFKAYAGTTVPNPPSVALHQAVGFELVGVYRGVGYKLGGWRDVAWYERTLQAPHAQPRDPVPIAAVVGTVAGDSALALGLPRLKR